MLYRKIALGLLAVCCSLLLQAQIPPPRPNIIFIFADDLGYGEIGCYGQQKIETPHIDQLAAKGIRFTQFYSGSTVCAPARNSFLSGLHTGHIAVRGNKSFGSEGQTPLPETTVTFPMLLQQNGYATAAFGKWGLGFINTTGDPQKKGFDHFFGYNCQSLAHDYFPPYLWNDHNKVELDVNKLYDSVYSASLIHQKAIEYIEQSGTQPFFLYLPYTLPHGDVIGPHDALYNHYAKKFNEDPLPGDKLRTRPHNRVPEPLPHAQFAAMIGRLDQYVGEIVAVVEKKGIADKTLIIFTSDNGPHKENGGDPEFFNSNGPFKGIKRDLYEGGIRVPFMAYWPGIIKPRVTDMPAALWDMYPTFLEMAGVKRFPKNDGVSLWPVFSSKPAQPKHDYFYWEFHENDGRQAIRMGKWKAIKQGVNKENVKMELYDLNTDPEETKNVADENPKLAKKLEKLFAKAHRSSRDWPLLPDETRK